LSHGQRPALPERLDEGMVNGWIDGGVKRLDQRELIRRKHEFKGKVKVKLSLSTS
jgi:hypothetical protein